MSTESVLGADPGISARALASRRNGARSRGPKTAAGKARSARNALKHGLCAQKLLVLPEEDAAQFQALQARLLAELAPVGAVQAVLADRVVSAAWRLMRADRLEAEVLTFRRSPDADLGLALIRDGNGTRSFETVMRYRNAAMAELLRAQKTLQALQAETRAHAGPPAAAPARKPRVRPRVARRNEPEKPRENNALVERSTSESRPDTRDRNLPETVLAMPPATTRKTEPPRRGTPNPGLDLRAPRRTDQGAPGRDVPDTGAAVLTSSLARTKQTRESVSDQHLGSRAKG